MSNAVVFTLAIVLAGLAGYATQSYLFEDEQVELAGSAEVVGQIRQEFAIRDINGDIRNINEWDDKVILLNFWATWCPPCLKEIPVLIELQDRFGDAGLQVLGVAMDNEDAVSLFVEDSGMNYPVMAGEGEVIELARRYGNRIGALPYSVIIDRNSKIHSTFAGELTRKQALELLESAGLQI